MPVLETLGGALFGAVLQVLFHKLDSHQVLDYFRGRMLDEKLLKNLKRKLVSMNAVVDHAELKQFRNEYVKTWLDDVRDVLLDTEDLLDEIELEYQSSASKVRTFESKLKEVLDDLEFLLSQKDDLGLKNAGGVGYELGNKVLERKNESSSLVAEHIICGRDEDKEIILNWLTSSHDNLNQLSILAIVGMGGMGKTTLAQHLYNDPKMKEAGFDDKAWVCVSDEFDVLKVSKAIIGALTKSKDDSEDIEMVHGKLKENYHTLVNHHAHTNYSLLCMHSKNCSPPQPATEMCSLSVPAIKSAEDTLIAAGKVRGFQVTGRMGFAVCPTAAETRGKKLAAQQFRSRPIVAV